MYIHKCHSAVWLAFRFTGGSRSSSGTSWCRFVLRSATPSARRVRAAKTVARTETHPLVICRCPRRNRWKTVPNVHAREPESKQRTRIAIQKSRRRRSTWERERVLVNAWASSARSRCGHNQPPRIPSPSFSPRPRYALTWVQMRLRARRRRRRRRPVSS